DVTKFYDLFDSTSGHPPAKLLQEQYINTGSKALKDFIPNRIVSGRWLARVVDSLPRIYSDARNCLGVMPQARKQFRQDMSRLVKQYPQATLPPVSIVIGANNSGGTTGPSGVIIGLEVVCRRDAPSTLPLDQRFRHLIAHEIAHTQQKNQRYETVLDAALREGVAEFVAERISGEIANDHLKIWT